jgi:hypothetical protein
MLIRLKLFKFNYWVIVNESDLKWVCWIYTKSCSFYVKAKVEPILEYQVTKQFLYGCMLCSDFCLRPMAKDLLITCAVLGHFINLLISS